MARARPFFLLGPSRVRQAAWPLGLAVALAATVVAAAGPGRPRAADDSATITHVLNRVGFGAAPGQVERVRELGLARYLEVQLHPESLPDAGMPARLAQFETLGLSSREIGERYFGPALELRRDMRRAQASARDGAGTGAPPAEGMTAPTDTPPAGPLANLSPEQRRLVMDTRRRAQSVVQELAQQKLVRAVYSERQLQEVLVDFWFNHFNVFAGKGPVSVYLTEYERDVIRPHVLGSFRELLGAVAHSSAMLFYLDNWQSSDPGASARAGRAAGRASMPRPLGQRAPRGLNENYARELLELHTLGVDGGYSQQDIVEVARAFTGWTIRAPRQGGGFWFDERRHATGAKRVLGTSIDRGGESDGEAVLDLLARHPSTATFIATKLARRFVADTPPAAVVRRAAETFTRTNGDLREVTRAILTSPDFLSAEFRRAKVKTPFEFVASALRTSGAEITGALPLVRQLRELGMPLYLAQPPTGYADRADAWVNTGSLIARMNVAVALAGNRLPGVHTDLDALSGGGALEESRKRLMDRLLAGEVSETTRQTLARGTDVAQIAALTLGSPEFQRR